MKTPFLTNHKSTLGSVLIVVMIVCLGLVALTLVFGSSMVMAYRGADNSQAGQQADQAIEGAARFFDTFYRKENKTRTGSELNEKGQLVIFPVNTLESSPDKINGTDSLSGLIAISEAVLALPEDRVRREVRIALSQLLDEEEALLNAVTGLSGWYLLSMSPAGNSARSLPNEYATRSKSALNRLSKSSCGFCNAARNNSARETLASASALP